MFISKNTEDKSISNYKLIVQVPRIINYYPKTIFVDSQLTEISDNLCTIYSKKRSLNWNPYGFTKFQIANNYHQLTMLQLKVSKIHNYS